MRPALGAFMHPGERERHRDALLLSRATAEENGDRCDVGTPSKSQPQESVLPSDDGDQDDSAEDGWEDPTPFAADKFLPAFPTSALPPAMSLAVQEVSRAMGTAEGMAAVVALGVVGTLTAGRLSVELRDGWTVPVNFYGIATAASGEGKSPVVEFLKSPLDELEQRLRTDAEPEIRRGRAAREVLEQHRDAKLRQARQKDTAPADLAGIIAELSELDDELAATSVPTSARFYTMEPTPEALIDLLSAHSGRMAILSDEGGEMFELMARYSNSGKTNLGVFLAGFDGRLYRPDRATKVIPSIPSTNLTIAVTVQPSVLGDLAADRSKRDRGLLPRFLYVISSSSVGYRDTAAQSVSHRARAAWRAFVFDLEHVAMLSEPVALIVDGEARALFSEWHARHERRLRPGHGDLALLADWGNKLPGQVGRLAGLLHVGDYRTCPHDAPIDATTMRRALDLGDFFADHAKAAFAAMQTDPAVEAARRVRALLIAKELRSVTRRDIQRAMPTLFRRAEDVDPALALLVEYGYVRPLPTPEREPTAENPLAAGRRPSPTFLVNPRIGSTHSTETPNGRDSVKSVEGFGVSES